MLRNGGDFILSALVACAMTEYGERLEKARDRALHDCLSALWKRLERASGITGEALAHEIRVCSCMTASPRTLEELMAPFRRHMKRGVHGERPGEMLGKILNELPGNYAPGMKGKLEKSEDPKKEGL